MNTTVMTLNNLKRDILSLEIPSELDRTTVVYIRDLVLIEINKTIARKS